MVTDALSRVRDIRAGIDEQQEILERVQLSVNRKLSVLRGQLDEAMVSAVDWANANAQEAAEAGGYRSHSTIRDARERIAKRRVTVR